MKKTRKVVKKKLVYKIKGRKGWFYRKAGTLHRFSRTRDAKIKAKKVRKAGQPYWRGDRKGSRV
jgi:hypothetical protein